MTAIPDISFEQCVEGLLQGDFSRLKPVMNPAHLGTWLDQGLFAAGRPELDEALACACFLGETKLAEKLLDNGARIETSNRTGLDATHWAANRGHVETVRLLIARGAPLESLSHYDGTVLGTTVWSALNEPRQGQIEIAEALLQAGANLNGARLDTVGFPTGRDDLDAVLRRFGADKGCTVGD